MQGWGWAHAGAWPSAAQQGSQYLLAVHSLVRGGQLQLHGPNVALHWLSSTGWEQRRQRLAGCTLDHHQPSSMHACPPVSIGTRCAAGIAGHGCHGSQAGSQAHLSPVHGHRSVHVPAAEHVIAAYQAQLLPVFAAVGQVEVDGHVACITASPTAIGRGRRVDGQRERCKGSGGWAAAACATGRAGPAGGDRPSCCHAPSAFEKHKAARCRAGRRAGAAWRRALPRQAALPSWLMQAAVLSIGRWRQRGLHRRPPYGRSAGPGFEALSLPLQRGADAGDAQRVIRAPCEPPLECRPAGTGRCVGFTPQAAPSGFEPALQCLLAW